MILSLILTEAIMGIPKPEVIEEILINIDNVPFEYKDIEI